MNRIYFKGVILLACLVSLVIIMNRFAGQGGGTISRTMEAVDAPYNYRNLKRFDDNQKEMLKKKVAGFYVYRTDTTGRNVSIAVSDRLELKTNGIFWEVKDQCLTAPSGRRVFYRSVVTGYCNPFAAIPGSEADMVCDVRILRQVRIVDGDTCYGPSDCDTNWEIAGAASSFRLGDAPYAVYDTSHGALHSFFPDSVIKLVDNFKVKGCVSWTGGVAWLKGALAADCKAGPSGSPSPGDYRAFVERYYRPLYFEGLVASMLKLKKKESATLRFLLTVRSDGTAEKVEIKSRDLRGARLQRRLRNEVATWVFPRAAEHAGAQTAAFDLSFQRAGR